MPIILVADSGPVRTLTLNRPEVRNALSVELRVALSDALRHAEAKPSVRAVVLTGAGPAFCAGLDLRELESVLDASAEASRADAERLGDLLLQIHTMPKPVIAAVRGPAVAGGAGLASACDLVVAGEGSRLGYPEARIGFVAALVAVLLTRQVGDRRARELLLTAELVDAAAARDMGLVNEVVPDERVLARAQELAATVARNAPASLAATKRLLPTVSGLGLEDAMRYAAEMNALARGSADLREGVSAFLAKREPAWRTDGLDPEPDAT